MTASSMTRVIAEGFALYVDYMDSTDYAQPASKRYRAWHKWVAAHSDEQKYIVQRLQDDCFVACLNLKSRT